MLRNTNLAYFWVNVFILKYFLGKLYVNLISVLNGKNKG